LRKGERTSERRESAEKEKGNIERDRQRHGARERKRRKGGGGREGARAGEDSDVRRFGGRVGKARRASGERENRACSEGKVVLPEARPHS